MFLSFQRRFKLLVCRLKALCNLITLRGTQITFFLPPSSKLDHLTQLPCSWFGLLLILHWGFLWWLSGKECRLDSWVRKNPWRRKWYPIPVFLPGEYPWMVGYSQLGWKKESDPTKQPNSNVSLTSKLDSFFWRQFRCYLLPEVFPHLDSFKSTVYKMNLYILSVPTAFYISNILNK